MGSVFAISWFIYLKAINWASLPFKKDLIYLIVSYMYDVASGSEITPCNKIDKPLVVYRFSGNVMTSIITLHT